ncbi:hypothetical protein ACOSQ4_011506 [Xanthoceras sorbifolium]
MVQKCEEPVKKDLGIGQDVNWQAVQFRHLVLLNLTNLRWRDCADVEELERVEYCSGSKALMIQIEVFRKRVGCVTRMKIISSVKATK